MRRGLDRNQVAPAAKTHPCRRLTGRAYLLLAARPHGAPDGTGLRTAFLLACPDIVPLIALRLRAIHLANIW